MSFYDASVPAFLQILGSLSGILGKAEMCIRDRTSGSPIDIVDYAGATHDFDDPGKKRQSIEANRAARDDVLRRASALFAR